MLEYCNISSRKFTIFLINLSQIVYMIIIVKNYKREEKDPDGRKVKLYNDKIAVLNLIVNVFYFFWSSLHGLLAILPIRYLPF